MRWTRLLIWHLWLVGPICKRMATLLKGTRTLLVPPSSIFSPLHRWLHPFPGEAMIWMIFSWSSCRRSRGQWPLLQLHTLSCLFWGTRSRAWVFEVGFCWGFFCHGFHHRWVLKLVWKVIRFPLISPAAHHILSILGLEKNRSKKEWGLDIQRDRSGQEQFNLCFSAMNYNHKPLIL